MKRLSLEKGDKNARKRKKQKETSKKEKARWDEGIHSSSRFQFSRTSFYTQALIKLGMVKDPMTDKEEESVELAKRLIDLLDLLKERTKGNLKPEEEKFLAACLQQLRMSYMEKAKIINL